MSATYAITFLRKPSDPNHQKKLAALEALRAAGIDELPKALADYFGIDTVSAWEGEADFLTHDFVLVPRYHGSSPKTGVKGVTRDLEAHGDAVVIDIAELPEDVKVIRVTLS